MKTWMQWMAAATLGIAFIAAPAQALTLTAPTTTHHKVAAKKVTPKTAKTPAKKTAASKTTSSSAGKSAAKKTTASTARKNLAAKKPSAGKTLASKWHHPQLHKA